MSLVHIIVTKVTGYDNVTLYFDDRSEKDIKDANSFSVFEKEFMKSLSSSSDHPEYAYHVSYYGYIIFPKIDAKSIFDIYSARCESKPNLKRRYNIYFDQEHVHLEDVIKKFDRPIQPLVKATQKLKTYGHRLEYLERSIQILRDIQTAIYETGGEILRAEMELHNRFREISDGTE